MSIGVLGFVVWSHCTLNRCCGYFLRVPCHICRRQMFSSVLCVVLFFNSLGLCLFFYPELEFTTTLSTIGVVMYDNADTQKEKIYNENRGKVGVYRWTNLCNGKFYIGSSTNLSKRFTKYYSLTYLTKQSKSSIILKALLKYGHSKFSLEILEYCEANKVIEREQYYIDKLNPEYNLLKFAGLSLGYKHTEETLSKLKGRKHSKETIEKMKNKVFSEETKKN